MDYGINRKLGYIFGLIVIGSLAGCGGGSGYAPVIEIGQHTAIGHNYYRVQPGDTLYSIAWAFGMDYRDLARINNLSSPSQLHIGQRLAMSYRHRLPHRKRVSRKERVKRPAVRFVDRVHYHSVQHWLWPVRGKIVSKFSKRPGGNRGLNITASYGAPIRSTAAGLVVYSGSGLRGYGKLIIIKHNASYLSAYAHNKTMLVKEGQLVKAGQKIATMGRDNSGKVVLHFEIRRNGIPANPLRYL